MPAKRRVTWTRTWCQSCKPRLVERKDHHCCREWRGRLDRTPFSHADICGDFSPRNQREQEVITEPIYSGDGDEWGEQTRVVDTSSTGAMVSRAASALRSAWSRVRRNSWVEPVAFEDLLTSLDY